LCTRSTTMISERTTHNGGGASTKKGMLSGALARAAGMKGCGSGE
jgi:hypothetical protein